MDITLRFAATLQSWGMEEHYMGQRRTHTAPTHSAICGLIGNVMGLDREDEDELKDILSRIRIKSVKNAKPVHKLIDYQIVGIYGRKRETADGSYIPDQYTPVNKEYLQDSDFEVVIEGDDALMKKVRAALICPKRPPHLGRKCCTGYEYVLKEA